MVDKNKDNKKEKAENSEILDNQANTETSKTVDIGSIVKRFYPEADTSTPEKLIAAVTPLVENIVSFHDDLNEVVEEFPEFGDFLIALRKGYTPAQAIAMFFDPDTLNPTDDNDEGIMKAKQHRRKAVDERNARMTQIDTNIEGSLANIQALGKAEGWSPEQIDKFADNIAALFNDWADGNLTMESLESLKKGFSHDDKMKEKDEEIEKAFQDGEVSGKNKKISKKRASRERGDGLAHLSNTGGSGKKVSSSIAVNDDSLPSRRLNFKTK